MSPFAPDDTLSQHWVQPAGRACEQLLSAAALHDPALTIVLAALGTVVLARAVGRIATAARLKAIGTNWVVAGLMGSWMFRHEPRIFLPHVVQAGCGAALHLLAVIPMLLVALPLCVPLFDALDGRFSHAPFKPGETAVVWCRLAADVDDQAELASAIPTETETLPTVELRDASRRRWVAVAARVPAQAQPLRLCLRSANDRAGAQVAEIPLATTPQYISATHQLPPGSLCDAIVVEYPPGDYEFLGLRLHWILAYVLATAALFWISTSRRWW